MRRYTLAQITGCLKELDREERERALVQMTMTQAAIAGALGEKEATAAVVEKLTAE